MKIPNIRDFKTFPDSVRYGILFMLGGWIWFYIAIYTTLMKGDVSPQYLIGIPICLGVLLVHNIGRILCMLAQVMIALELAIPSAVYFLRGDPFRGAMAGLVVVLFGASSYFLYIKESSSFFKAYRKKDNGTETESGEGASAPTEPENLDPHTLLGVEPGASAEEIRSAYQRLAQHYHPKKIRHKGAKYRELAAKRFKAIQEAYNTLVPKKSKKKKR